MIGSQPIATAISRWILAFGRNEKLFN